MLIPDVNVLLAGFRADHVHHVAARAFLHWERFAQLCRTLSLRASLVPDAYLAALAIEERAELVTFDRGFARYPGLRWRSPADG